MANPQVILIILMQAYTFALLLAGVSANGLIENCDGAVSAASNFGSAIKNGARGRSYGKQAYQKHYEDFCGQLDSFHSYFQSCDKSEFNDSFNDKFCDFENNVADCLDNLNNYGNNCGGYDVVWEWSSTIWGKWNDICDQFGDKGDCKDVDHVYPHHKHAEDCFATISRGWDFGGHDCTYPSRDPWHHHSTCDASSSTPAPTTAPLTKSTATPTPAPTTKASSSKVSPVPSSTSTKDKPVPTTSTKVSPVPSSSSTEDKPVPSSSTKPVPTTPTEKPSTATPTDTRPFSTYTGPSTTYRCHVNGAAVTGANA